MKIQTTQKNFLQAFILGCKNRTIKARNTKSWPLTSCAVLSKRLKEVKACCGSVLHWEEFAKPAGCWRVHTPHLAVQNCLEMTTFPPQQRRNISKKSTTAHL